MKIIYLGMDGFGQVLSSVFHVPSGKAAKGNENVDGWCPSKVHASAQSPYALAAIDSQQFDVVVTSLSFD